MGAGKRARRLHSFSRCERSDPSLNPSEARWRSQKKVTDGLMIDPLWVKKKRTYLLARTLSPTSEFGNALLLLPRGLFRLLVSENDCL